MVVLWEMASYNSEVDGWQLGMVPVRAHMVEEIVQNYTVTLSKHSSFISFLTVESCSDGRWREDGLGCH